MYLNIKLNDYNECSIHTHTYTHYMTQYTLMCECIGNAFLWSPCFAKVLQDGCLTAWFHLIFQGQ